MKLTIGMVLLWFALLSPDFSYANNIFGEYKLYGTGYFPSVVATADFNNDGKKDVVTANQFETTVSVLLGNGDGTFQEKKDYSVGVGASSPYSVGVADFNNDGNTDIVTTTSNYSENNASILIGNGDRTFQTNVTYSVAGAEKNSLAVGDFNGDGNADIATACTWGNTISILLGKGDGSFQSEIINQAELNPYYLISADFNNDGFLDLAAANWGSTHGISIYFGNGDGTFQASVNYNAGPWSISITSGDFNGDGIVDLAAANVGYYPDFNSTVTIFIGFGDGTFLTATECSTGIKSFSISNGDFNNDGKLDLVTANYGSNNVSLLHGNGDGTFQEKIDYGVGRPPLFVATADFNDDGRLDLVTADPSWTWLDTISILLNISGIIDAQPPTGAISINGNAVSTNSTSVTLILSASDAETGTSQMRFSNDNAAWSSWEPYSASKNWTLTNTSDLMTAYVQFMDMAGNVSISYSDTIYMDTDSDGIYNSIDNCYNISNSDQADLDGDGIGNVCDDSDGDGIYDAVDNCPNVSNPLQEDRNGNGIGDACDGDIDGDTLVDIRDNCPTTYNLDQLDTDGDGTGDVCDACISDPQNNCLNSSSLVSADISQPVTISNFTGTASVTIEPGDIITDTSITVTGQTTTSNFALGSNQQVLGAIYTFTADPPADINSPFNSPITITLKYDQGTMPEGGRTEQNFDIYYYDTATLTWITQNAIQDMVNNTLTLNINHFSSYAVIATENPISDLSAAFKEIRIENGGTWASLFEKIGYAYNYYEQGDLGKTKETLKAFTNELKALSGKKLDSASADMLIQFANEVMARL